MSSLVQRATDEQPRPTSGSALEHSSKEQDIKHLVLTLPRWHPYRIHFESHIDLDQGEFKRFDDSCQFCTAYKNRRA